CFSGIGFAAIAHYLYTLKLFIMYLIREVFQAKPGKAKDLVKMFKQAAPHFEKMGAMKAMKVMTDAVSTYWTVVVESETDDIGSFFSNMRSATMSDEL